MKLLNKKVIKLSQPIPVYDIESPITHNFCIGKQGIVVHNSMKNGQKTLESEEVIMILGALGFDPKLDDPMKKLQVQKIICLADPDPRQ